MIGRKTETSTSGTKQPNLDKVAVGYWYNFSKNAHVDADHRLRAQIRVGIQGRQQRLRRGQGQSGNLYIQPGLRHEF